MHLSWRVKLNSGLFCSWKVLVTFESLILYPLWYICLCNQHRSNYLKFGFFLKYVVYWVQIKCRVVFQHFAGFGFWVLGGSCYIFIHFVSIVKKLCICILLNLQSALKFQCNSPKVVQCASHGNGLKWNITRKALSSLVSILVLFFANDFIRISLCLSLLDSKFTFINALTSQRVLFLESWGPLRKQKLSVK